MAGILSAKNIMTNIKIQVAALKASGLAGKVKDGQTRTHGIYLISMGTQR
jgi:hypothetical protein